MVNTRYTDDVLQNYTFETYIILLTNVTPINSIKILYKDLVKKRKKKKHKALLTEQDTKNQKRPQRTCNLIP